MYSLEITADQSDKIVVAALTDMILRRDYDAEMPVSQMLDVLQYFSTYEDFAKLVKEICNKG